MPERDSEKKKKNPLEEALGNFMELLPDMLTHYEGHWVAFGPTDKEPVGGYWHNELDARKVAIEKYGLNLTEDAFVVRQVSREYLPQNIENRNLVLEGVVS